MEEQWPGDEAGKSVGSPVMLAAEEKEVFWRLEFCEENVTDNVWLVGPTHNIDTLFLVVPRCQLHRYSVLLCLIPAFDFLWFT